MFNIEEIAKKYPGARVFEDGFEVEKAKHSGAAGQAMPVFQKKRWGGEVWIIYTDQYALKILYVNKGCRLSLQKHNKKTETWQVLKGEPELTINKDVVKAKPGNVFHIPAGTVHRISAMAGDVEILEVSSPELWDLERIEDDYGRGQYAGHEK